jgi:hypothetical protein
MNEVVTYVPYARSQLTLVVSERVVAYSFDQFTDQAALDRIVLARGSG